MLQKNLVNHFQFQNERLKSADVYEDLTPSEKLVTAVSTTATVDRHGRTTSALSFNGTTSYVNLDSIVPILSTQTIGSIVIKGRIGDFLSGDDIIFSFGQITTLENLYFQISQTDYKFSGGARTNADEK